MESNNNLDNEQRMFNMDIRDLMDIADVQKSMDETFIQGNYEQYIRGLDILFVRLENLMSEELKKSFEHHRQQIRYKQKDKYRESTEYNREHLLGAHKVLRKAMSENGIINIKGLNPSMAALE